MISNPPTPNRKEPHGYFQKGNPVDGYAARDLHGAPLKNFAFSAVSNWTNYPTYKNDSNCSEVNDFERSHGW